MDLIRDETSFKCDACSLRNKSKRASPMCNMCFTTVYSLVIVVQLQSKPAAEALGQVKMGQLHATTENMTIMHCAKLNATVL